MIFIQSFLTSDELQMILRAYL